MQLAEEGRKRGIMPPKILCSAFPEQLALQVVEYAHDSPLFVAFDEHAGSFPADDRERLRARATEAIEDQVLPAYKKLDRYFNQTYLPAARDSIGLSACPTAVHGMNISRAHTPRHE